jgi:hypothetical protein
MVQGGMQARGQGQAEWSGRRTQCQGRQNGQAGGLSVRAGKRSEPGGLEKRDRGKQELGKTLVDLTRQTGNRQTENTGINTLRAIGKMGDTWRGVVTITRTGENRSGCDIYSAFRKYSDSLTSTCGKFN